MSRVLRTLLSVSATLALTGAAASASAQSLVGVWSHHVVDPRTGQYVSVIWDEFTADGRLHAKWVTPAGTIDIVGRYQVLNGGAVVRAVYTDYGPKVRCTLVCTASPPPAVMNQPGDSPMRFAGPNVVYFGADMYTRH